MQDYLQPENVKNVTQAKNLFSARTRMLDVGDNFSNKYGKNVKCKLGCEESDTQSHLLSCQHLAGNDLLHSEDNVNYDDLFSNQVEDKLIVAAVLETKYRLRKKKTK